MDTGLLLSMLGEALTDHFASSHPIDLCIAPASGCLIPADCPRGH